MILERLDTFIAFAVVMLLLSVMVMSFVQLVVSMLGLRGRNLRWGVELLLKEAAPEVFEAGGGLNADKIAHEMLTHPALGPARNWGAMLLRWILVKTRALKAIGEPSPNDGWLRRAVRSLFETIGVFRNGRRPATALKPEDVIKVLERVHREAAKSAAGAEAAKSTATKKDASKSVAPGGDGGGGADAAKAKQLAALLGAEARETEEFVAEAKKLAAGLKQHFPEQAKLLERQIETLGKSGAHLAARVDEWFDTVMTATSERFKLRTRWLTVAGALVLAFGFQVDSLSIFRQLSGDAKLRDGLVAQATTSQQLYQDLQVAATEKPAPPAAGDAGGDTPEAARQRVDAAREGLKKASELVEATGLDILNPMYATWKEFRCDFVKLLPLGEPPDAVLKKLGTGLSGKFMTVLLLSLGAPFWYGALSKLIGLRSAVAKKKEKKEDGDGASGGAGGQG